MNLSYWPFMIYLPIWFHAGLGYDSVATGLALLAYTLPTLVMPPLAERLSLRYQPGIIIPAGLAIIGVGFILMKFGSAAARPDWLTMLPDRRNRSWDHQYARHQHDDGLRFERPGGHGLGHRHERPHGFAGGEHSADGLHPGKRRAGASESKRCPTSTPASCVCSPTASRPETPIPILPIPSSTMRCATALAG